MSEKLTISIGSATLNTNISSPTVGVKISGNRAYTQYTGPTTVTPSDETQVLLTAGRNVMQNITINPIPSNYGRVSYDGSVLTIQ